MRIFAIGVLFCMGMAVYAQSTKEVVRLGITSQTIFETDYSEGLNESLIEQEEFYNERGDLIELKEYNKKGEINRWEKYAYSKEGELTSEQFLDKKGNLEKKIVYVYKDGLKMEKLYYDNKDRLIKKKKYVYKFRK